MLNAKGKDLRQTHHHESLQRRLTSAFFDLPGLPRHLSDLRGQLTAKRLADGFQPIAVEYVSNGVLDPVEFVARAYDHWEHAGWPGRNIRLTYAHTLFAMYVLKLLEDLSLVMLQQPAEETRSALRHVQALLDRMNGAGVPNVPVFVKDARWLILTAQSPATQHVGPYFDIAQQLSRSLTDADRLDVHKASAKMTGGHLRSQLRYQAQERGLSIDDVDILAYTRTSNAMDNALLVYDLVPLLEAYEAARVERDAARRVDLADAILQGISTGPELFLARRDLLTPCTIVEHLFVEQDEDGRARYTPLGDAHLERLSRYGELIARLASSLEDDALRLAPAPDGYSPLGIVYGFSSDILGNMAMRTLIAKSALAFSLEDAFVASDDSAVRLAWTTPWKSPFHEGGARAILEYSPDLAEQIYQRLRRALHALTAPTEQPHRPTGQLFVIPSSVATDPLTADRLPEGVVPAQEFVYSTADQGQSRDVAYDRKEGRCLVSYQSDGEWVAVSKSVLTHVMDQGRDAVITGIDPKAIEVLRLTCPGVIVL